MNELTPIGKVFDVLRQVEDELAATHTFWLLLGLMLANVL